MSSRPETGRTAWTDSFEFRIAKELGLMNPGRARCLKCQEVFESEDVIYNRICPHCKELNYDVVTNENCEGEFLYIESFDGKRGLEDEEEVLDEDIHILFEIFLN